MTKRVETNEKSDSPKKCFACVFDLDGAVRKLQPLLKRGGRGHAGARFVPAEGVLPGNHTCFDVSIEKKVDTVAASPEWRILSVGETSTINRL